jgi:hypothetical protein
VRPMRTAAGSHLRVSSSSKAGASDTSLQHQDIVRAACRLGKYHTQNASMKRFVLRIESSHASSFFGTCSIDLYRLTI